MKFYDLKTEFTFGKFEGKTMEEVLNLQPDYIDWCAKNLDHFYISDETINELKALKPDFLLTQEASEILNSKYEKWDSERDDYDDNDNFEPDYDRDTFDALTDGQYGDYDDWRENGGDFDSLMDGLGY